MNGSNRLAQQESIATHKHTESSPKHKKTSNKQDSQNSTHDHEHSIHPHVHSEESLRKIVNRLSRIEGHIRGIKSMVQQNSPCPDVLLQIAAVRGALDRVARIVLDEHLTECIGRAAQEGDIEVELEQLKAALDRFLP
ncbi:MAG: metal-sensitive transcriptional regulator [Calothrix sp. MO_167.B12]|nr:metal-sensitive transcriptional regulator [Calothrix sp. MO_167.B12]